MAPSKARQAKTEGRASGPSSRPHLGPAREATSGRPLPDGSVLKNEPESSSVADATTASVRRPGFSREAATLNHCLVVAYVARRTQSREQVPEVKPHVYLPGMGITACGFGLSAMRLFGDLRFSDQAFADRCPILLKDRRSLTPHIAGDFVTGPAGDR
jgi:hypothetical protein